MGVNTWYHANSVSFKCHSIRVTFKICAVLGAQGIRATGFRRAQGNQHCAKFESHSNRVTFETNAISVISSVHPLGNTMQDQMYVVQCICLAQCAFMLVVIDSFKRLPPCFVMMVKSSSVHFVITSARAQTVWHVQIRHCLVPPLLTSSSSSDRKGR